MIATQNPVEFRGTYPLPEAQMDRFALQFGLGYVEPAEEVAILADQAERHPLDALAPCVSLDDVLALRAGRAPGPRHRRGEALRRRPGPRHPHGARRAAGGRAPGPPSRSSAPPRRSRCSTGRRSCRPSTCRSWRCPSSPIASRSIHRHASPAPPPWPWSRRSSRPSPSRPERAAVPLPQLPRGRRSAAPARPPPHAGRPARRRRPGRGRRRGAQHRLTVGYQAFAFLAALLLVAALAVLRRPPACR